MLDNLFEKKIVIFGYGVEGKGLVDFLISRGASNITVFDEKDIPKKQRISGVSYSCGPFESQYYEGIDLAFRSPGIKIERLRKVLPEAVVISSPANLFFDLAKGKKIIVTGTKGKSTTANIIYQILKDNGLDAYLGGNVGNLLLGFVDDLSSHSYTVAELSSFQLHDFSGVADYCVYLPIISDHMDYHSNFKEYFDAKKQAIIKMDGGVAVLTAGNESYELAVNDKVQYLYYSTSAEIESGCYLNRDGCTCQGRDETVKIAKVEELSRKYKIPIVDILAAISLAYALDLKIDIDHHLKAFNKPDYRIEQIHSGSGVEFFNDSASTNPISTIEALKLLTKPTVLIMGGSSKGLAYEELAKAIVSNSKVRLIFLIGETADAIKSSLLLAGWEGHILKKNNLEEVFEDLAVGSKNYGSILFSPASASFDQYRDYKDRGRSFSLLVKRHFP